MLYSFYISDSGMRQPDTEVWTAEPVPELISCESNVCDTEDMMLPLDLCINRNGMYHEAPYRKTPKNSDTPKHACNYPKTGIVLVFTTG